MLLAALAQAASGPIPVDMKTTIQAALDRKLLDGASARYAWPSKRAPGSYCGWVNAKNSYGAYTGWNIFLVVGGFNDGPKGNHKFQVVEVLLGGTDGIAEKMCAQEGYDISNPPT
jgi:hypothetical protein